jgi:hypothetical protein
MTLQKKSSRTLIVDGLPYRYMVRRSDAHVRDQHGPMTMLVFTAQADEGGLLQVTMYERHVGRSLPPSIVTGLIRYARRALDWDPMAKGTRKIGPDDAVAMLVGG